MGCEGQCVSFGIIIWIISSSYRKWGGITVMTHPLPSDISFCLLRPLVSRQWRSATAHWRRSNCKHRPCHVFRLVERSRKWLEHKLVWNKTQTFCCILFGRPHGERPLDHCEPKRIILEWVLRKCEVAYGKNQFQKR